MSSVRRAIVVVVALAVSPIVVAGSAAHASCGLAAPLREAIDDAEAVIVGTVTEAGVPDPSVPKAPGLGRRLRWTIDVEADVKDNVGDTLSFHAGATGGFVSSQFTASRGERLGLLLSRRDGEYWASACDKRRPGAVLEAAEPLPPPRGRGLPLLLAAGAFGSPRVALFDERGLATRFGTGRGDARVDVCPDERLMVEVVSDTADFVDDGTPTHLDVRDMRSMKVIRSERLPGAITGGAWRKPFAVECRDRTASDVLVAARAGIYSARVVRWRGEGWTISYHAKARAVTFIPDGFAVIRHGGEKFELAVHAPDGDRRMRLGPLPTFKHLSISEPVRFVADPSGRYVAGANEEPDNGRDNLFVADLETRKVARARVPWVDGLAWAGTDLVVGPLVERDPNVVTGEEVGDVRVYGAGLALKHEWKRWTGHVPVVLGERLYGVRPARDRPDGSYAPAAIVSAPYRSGPERVENAIGDARVDQFIALSGEGAAAARGGPRFTWAAIALLVLLVALAAIVIRSRRIPAPDRTPPKAS